jgi:hypothetical protein
VIETNNIMITRELHLIRAHLLHYASLLEDFRKSVQFVLDTPNPAMESDLFVNDEKGKDRKLLVQEAGNLLSEIKRLEMSRTMQDKRLKNVMNLVSISVPMLIFRSQEIPDAVTLRYLAASIWRIVSACRG